MINEGALLGGRYRLEEQIGKGRFGEVWRATDEANGQRVAAKVLHRRLVEEAPGVLEMFISEAIATAAITHTSVIRIHDVAFAPLSGAYLIMDYVEGRTLSRELGQTNRLTPHETMVLVAQAAGALQAAHDKGILHGDVKPANIMVRTDGPIVLTDFGIGRLPSEAASESSHAILDSVHCGAPRLLWGKEPTSVSDIFSLGVVAYRCLAGRWPFGGSVLEIARGLEQGTPPGLPSDVPDRIRSIVEHAMSGEPNARPAAVLADRAGRAAVDFAPREVFISYRWGDAKGFAGWIFERLRDSFDQSKIYFDTETISASQDFVERSVAAASASRVVLVLIGPGWPFDRLHEPGDLVRQEIVAALRARTSDPRAKVVPVLVGGATMPHRSQLPEALQALADLVAVEIHNSSPGDSIGRLIDEIQR